jgi:hypothetical protein
MNWFANFKLRFWVWWDRLKTPGAGSWVMGPSRRLLSHRRNLRYQADVRSRVPLADRQPASNPRNAEGASSGCKPSRASKGRAAHAGRFGNRVEALRSTSQSISTGEQNIDQDQEQANDYNDRQILTRGH